MVIARSVVYLGLSCSLGLLGGACSSSGATGGEGGTTSVAGASGAGSGGTPVAAGAGSGGTSGGSGGGGAGGGSGGAAAGAAGTAGGGAGAGAGGGTAGGSGGAAAGAAGTAGGGAGAGAGAGGGTAGGGATSKALVSDDFEATAASGPPDPAKWTISTIGGNGMITIDGSVGRNSARSLRVNGMNQFHTMAMLQGAPLFPAPGNKIGGRVYIRLAQAMPTGHVTWLEAGSVMNDDKETRIGANLGMLDINRWPGDNDQRAPGKVLTAMTWHCLEFLFDGTLHDARVWLDSAELSDLHVTNWVAPNPANGGTTPVPDWAPPYAAIRLGWELGGGEVWFDDVAFGHDRIGCL